MTPSPHPPLGTVRDGGAGDVPLLLGTTRDEHKLYVPAERPEIDDAELERQVRTFLPRRAADRAGEVVEVYRASRAERGLPASSHDLVDAVATGSRFRMPAIRLAEAQQAHQPRTFLYQFEWESPARRGTLGACHGLEIPFVFGTLGRTGDDRMSGTGADADRLSRQMMDAWIELRPSRRPQPRRHRTLARLRTARAADDGLRPLDRRAGSALRRRASRVGVLARRTHRLSEQGLDQAGTGVRAGPSRSAMFW